MKTRALYAGSFDPITFGHIDIIQRMRPFFDSLNVVVAHSPWKSYLFSMEERMNLLTHYFKNEETLKVDCCKGLLSNYAKENNIKLIIRGARSVSDFEYELGMSNTNKELFPECETILAFTQSKYNHYSSKIVKEIASHEGDVSRYVPKHVAQALKEKYISKIKRD